LPCAGNRVKPAPLTAQQIALYVSKRRAGTRQPDAMLKEPVRIHALILVNADELS
jgi:hypothetical protein